MQLSCIWFTICHTSFMIGCVFFTSFTKIAVELVGYLVGFLLGVEIRVESEQMLSEWCTVLLRNLSTVLHSGRSCTLLHLLPCPSNASCSHALFWRGADYLPRCNSSFWPYVHSWQFTSIKLYSTYKLLCEMKPLGFGVFILLVACLSFRLPYSTFLKASHLN